LFFNTMFTQKFNKGLFCMPDIMLQAAAVCTLRAAQTVADKRKGGGRAATLELLCISKHFTCSAQFGRA